MKPPQGGLIVRTVAEGLTKKQLKADVGYLVRLWGEIAEEARAARSARRRCSTSELDLVLHDRARPLHRRRRRRSSSTTASSTSGSARFVEMFMPERVEATSSSTTGDEPIFDEYGIEDEIARALVAQGAAALGRLPDHRSGRGAHRDRRQHRPLRRQGRKDLEETILKTNLEAVEGDRLPAPLPQHRRPDRPRLHRHGARVATARRSPARSRAARRRTRRRPRSTASRELGLIEMTRKRTRESLGRTLHEPCFYCDGTGQLQSKQTIAYEILRQIRRERGHAAGLQGRRERAPGGRATCCKRERARTRVQEAERRFTRQIVLVAAQGVPPRAVRPARAGEQRCRATSDDDDERRDERVTINKEFESFDAFIQEYVTNISRTGVFVQRKTPLPIGTKVNLRFTVIMDDIETHRGHRRGRARAGRSARHGRRLHASSASTRST